MSHDPPAWETLTLASLRDGQVGRQLCDPQDHPAAGDRRVFSTYRSQRWLWVVQCVPWTPLQGSPSLRITKNHDWKPLPVFDWK